MRNFIFFQNRGQKVGWKELLFAAITLAGASVYLISNFVDFSAVSARQGPALWEAASPKAARDAKITVYITKTGAKYHKENCHYLSRSKTSISLQDAKAQGYSPCKVCKPPK